MKKLTPTEQAVILDKGTEAPFSGEYNEHFASGVYTCRQCKQALFLARDKFKSHCGWPSFDDAIINRVKQVPDADGTRTEIVCAHCDGHLGHVFKGEMLTDKNTRYCVNSISLDFVPAAVFASGCFWGTEYWFEKLEGVLQTRVGYAGGDIANPTYHDVCSGTTGHVEAVSVVYDPRVVSYETLTQCFFETHDPTQTDGQGPDKGSQYLSVIFYNNQTEKQTAEKLITQLSKQGLTVVTKLLPLEKFYPERCPAHQHYYQKSGHKPYCHIYTKRF